jgi:hypothetical protein
MSSTTSKKIYAKSLNCPIKDGFYKGFWNGDLVSIGSHGQLTIKVNVNIWEPVILGGSNVRCLVEATNNQVTVESFVG